MKKILLSLAALTMGLFAVAETVTFDFTTKPTPSNGDWTTSYAERIFEFPEATVTFENANWQQSGNAIDDCPVTKGKPVTVKAKNGTNISAATIVCKQWGTKPQTITAASSTDGETFVDIEDASSDNFTLALATLPEGTVAVKFVFSSTQNQIGIQSITCTFGDAPADFIAPPTFSPAAGAVVAGTEVFLSAPGADTIFYTTDGSEPTTSSFEFVAPTDGSEFHGIVINEPTTIKAIACVGEKSSEVATAEYTIIPAYTSVAELNALADKTKFVCDVALVAVYNNGSTTYVYDGKDYGMIYQNGFAPEAGDVIKAGWVGTITVYGGLAEYKTVTTPEIEGSADLPAPVAVATAEEYTAAIAPMVNFITIKNATVAEATPDATASSAAKNYTVMMGETEVACRNNFGMESIEPGNYDITGFITLYNDTKPLYVTAVAPAGEGGLSDVATDNAPVVLYNLQGVRVANPAAGTIVIRVHGNKATKVLVK